MISWHYRYSILLFVIFISMACSKSLDKKQVADAITLSPKPTATATLTLVATPSATAALPTKAPTATKTNTVTPPSTIGMALPTIIAKTATNTLPPQVSFVTTQVVSRTHEGPVPVVAILDEASGAGESYRGWAELPKVVVYADGRVIFTDGEYGGQMIHEVWVDSAEICTLLAQIESTGFFEYDASTYQDPWGWHAPITNIQINGNKRNNISVYHLSAYENGETLVEDTPYPLLETRRALRLFEPQNATRYRPNKVIVTGGRAD